MADHRDPPADSFCGERSLNRGKECIGAVKVYAALPHAYDSSSEKLLELFAGPAATLLSHVQASEAPIA